MGSPDQDGVNGIKVDAGNLYREETFTDLRVATLRRLVPVRPDGSADGSREPIFVGETHVMTNAGPLPIECRIEAKTLEEAMAKFPEAVTQAVAEMVEHVRKRQRQEASRIVVPQPGARPPNIQLP